MLKRCFIFENKLILFNTNVKSYCTKKEPLISCRRPRYNCRGEGIKKKTTVALASDGWYHKKSKGDHFTINPNLKPEVPVSESFEQCGIIPDICSLLAENRIKKPTVIQERSFPLILSGANCIIAAETGCGKTLAYLIPILQQLYAIKSLQKSEAFNSPLALILSPNRELASQIAEVALPLCKGLSLNCDLVLGGHTSREIKNSVFKEVDIVIGSFGAFSKQTTNRIYKTNRMNYVVLDEADTLLDDSFNEKLVYFLNKINFHYKASFPPTGAQLLLASATMPTNLPEIINKVVDGESFQKITTENLHMIPNVKQKFIRIGKDQRPVELLKIANTNINKREPLMIFSNKAETCDWIVLFLKENGIKCINLNSKMPVDMRQTQYDLFKSGEVNIISCTDIGSRGLDTTRTRHVLNFEFPYHMADYVHRCGRTARVGSGKGCHVTSFITYERDIKMLQEIELAVRKLKSLPKIDGNTPKLVERYYKYLEDHKFRSPVRA